MDEELTAESLALRTILNNPAVKIVAHLAQNPIDPAAETVDLTELVECTFPGYAAIRIEDWEVFPGELEDIAEALSPVLEWEAGVIVTPQRVTMVYITVQIDGGDLLLLDTAPVDPALVMDVAGRKFTRSYRLFSYDAAAT